MDIRCLLFLFCGVLSPTLQQMGSEVKPVYDPDLVETLTNLQHWKEEIERKVSSVEKKSLEHKNQLLEKKKEEEVKSKNRADDLSLKLQEVRSIEEEFRSALERQQQKSHSLQVQMTELISELHSVDLIKKDVTFLTDNLRQDLNERLAFGLETIQSNLTENMRVFENSSLKFSKHVSNLEENLKSIQKSSKTELETLHSELSPRFETLEGKSSRCDDVPELKNTLTDHSSRLSRLNQQLLNYENTCAGEPPSTPNGKPLKFDRKHTSVVQYECDPDFVSTRNSTVHCVYGEWEGQPPNCSVFDTSFILVADYSYQKEKITCYSERHVQKIAFSRVFHNRSGPGLPRNASTTREEGAVLQLNEVGSRVRTGAYECGFQLHNRSIGIVAPFNNYYGYVQFEYLSKVATIGDTVHLEVFITDYVTRLRLRWTRNGVPVPSWDGQTKVKIWVVEPDDAGIYRCYREGRRNTFQRLFRLIVRKCGKNRYGVSCEWECPACYNGGICHDLLGLCLCPAGFTGKNCELACGENHFGADCSAKLCTGSDCKYRFFCKPDPFGCACFPGFKGFMCSEPCPCGKYGADCKQICYCADKNRSCNRFTGACSEGCCPGWNGQSCQIPDLGTCTGEPPSTPNGNPLKFDRKHASVVQYECDPDFVPTGNSTVHCVNGGWEGQPPNCSFFDTTFILVAHYWFRQGKITCYSNRHVNKIAFSRVLDTGSGLGLQTNAPTRREGGVVLQINAVDHGGRTGAYECGFQLNNRYVGIVAPFNNDYGDVRFKYFSEVANIGDTVELEEVTYDFKNQSMLRWRRNGVPVPSWDGQTRVEISGLQPDDAGIYECYQEGKRLTNQRLFRLTVRKCGKSRYGVSCERKCPACYNGGICHDLFGLCMCPLGFTGKNCEFACGGNHDGTDCAKSCAGYDCRDKFFCKPDPFGCACFPGFTGLECNQGCEPGKYGADCRQTCHCAVSPFYCNRFTGACSEGCFPGWSGQSCQIPVRRVRRHRPALRLKRLAAP